MKIPIAIISGIILPLAVQNIGCNTVPTNGFETTTETKVKLGLGGLEWSRTTTSTPVGGGGTPAPQPAPGANQGTAPNGAEAKNPTTSVSTPNPVSMDGTVSSDSGVIAGATTLDDGSTWSGTVATAPDYTGDFVVYESHYGAY